MGYGRVWVIRHMGYDRVDCTTGRDRSSHPCRRQTILNRRNTRCRATLCMRLLPVERRSEAGDLSTCVESPHQSMNGLTRQLLRGVFFSRFRNWQNLTLENPTVVMSFLISLPFPPSSHTRSLFAVRNGQNKGCSSMAAITTAG